jgi:hypothetical protein
MTKGGVSGSMTDLTRVID